MLGRSPYGKNDDTVRALGGTVPFAVLEGDRTRDYMRARSTTNESGEIVITNPATIQLYDKIVRAITSYYFLLNHTPFTRAVILLFLLSPD